MNILVVGASGTGKTASLRNLEPEKTFYINVSGKPLPFPNKKWTNLLATDKTSKIIEALTEVNKREEIDTVVVDDAQYIMANEFLSRAKEKSYEKFNDIGNNFFLLLKETAKLRDNLKVIFLWHSDHDTDASGKRIVKAKTVGRLTDQYINVEGYFTIVLFTDVVRKEKKNHYGFMTQTDGQTTAKTPMGMFTEEFIENDMKSVLESIEKFYSQN